MIAQSQTFVKYIIANLFNNEKASKPLNPLVAKRLDTLQESDFSRKQKEWDDIAASMSKKSK